MSSVRFKDLTKRVSKLINHFVPKYSPTGDYNERQYDRMRGFRLLVYAEFEAFIEAIILDKVNQALDDFNEGKRLNNTLLALVIYTPVKLPGGPISSIKEAQSKAKKLQTIINEVVITYKNYINKKNNGIGEDDLLKILSPIGIEVESLDEVLLSDLASYTRLRGEVAHKSAAIGSTIDPKTEVDQVNKILNQHLKKIDELVQKL
ncbi:MAG: HEPN domain-containing protein [Microscillaceae bacterium]|nr:HEPN domain-containing protein [Microscillaceae bacterium]